ncbi:hydrolase, alpha/beta hydrolase [gamma proteobacterium HdN1]|nr:hydrolase, alpha/beta hydrolase [gamma proteobacterium HdN1]
MPNNAKPTLASPLPDWLTNALPWPRYLLDTNGYKMHYIDQGEGPVVLLQHGNPTWCFLWRKVIALLANEKVRVIAPDLIGFGASDHPRSPSEHSVDFHANNLLALVEQLNLRDITIVGQDWGGPVVSVMATRAPERIHGAVFANTAIRAPKPPIRVTPFHRFANMPIISDLVFKGANFPVPILHKVQGDPASIGAFERRAYAWPLRRWGDRASNLALARMVPTQASHPSVATLEPVETWAQQFQGPVELVWGTRDPILGPALKGTRKLFPNAPVTETAAGHFLQEEVPDVLAGAILRVAGISKS